VDLAAGRAMCSFKGRKPRIFDVETGRELEIGIASWPRRHFPLHLTSDGKSVICSVLPVSAFEAEPWISVDLATGAIKELADASPRAENPDGLPALGVGPGDTTTDRDERIRIARDTEDLPGCTRYPCTLLGDSLAIYEGLASPGSHPESWFGLTYPSFERSIRIADTRSQETATLVPRFRHGSFAYSRFDLPPKR
ncbi:MAG TPA: hypothetical protein VM509_05660, partial [Planctomycetota bacterium]|nr:hypothetical protein [Planctomycetota bacterium]